MKFYITYFYHIRNLPKTYLPISINNGEPNWFHEFQDRSHMFKDKRGIWNGGYIDEISSSNLEIQDPKVCIECDRKLYVGGNCPFMKGYYEKLSKLDFDKTFKKLQNIVNHFNCEDICFVVYEKPDCPCGERWVIKKWFEEHGITIEEFKYQKS